MIISSLGDLQVLPESIILQALGFLSPSDLGRSASVCRRWKELAYDHQLWKSINLTKCRLSVPGVRRVLELHGSPLLHSMSLQAIDSGNAALDSQLFALLRTHCPRLCSLELIEYELNQTKVLDLPRSLRCLKLLSCSLSAGWFAPLLNSDALPQLESLDLTKSCPVDEESLASICSLHTLKSLRLRQVSLSVSGLSPLLELRKLSSLDLSYSDVNDSFLQQVAFELTLLRQLNLTMTRVTNCGLLSIANGLPHLECLSVVACFGISNITPLHNLKHLKYVNANNTSVTKEMANEFRAALPACFLDHGHESVLRRKVAWTVTDKRFCI